MMTDKPPYATTTTSDDIYFACVDLVLSATAPMPDAGPTGGPDRGDGGGGTSGGCSASGSPSALLVLAVFCLLLRRRMPIHRALPTSNPG